MAGFEACAAYDRNLTTEGRGAALLLGFEQLSLQAPIWLKAMLAHDLLQMPTFTSYVNYATSSKEARKQIRVRIEATRELIEVTEAFQTSTQQGSEDSLGQGEDEVLGSSMNATFYRFVRRSRAFKVPVQVHAARLQSHGESLAGMYHPVL